MGFKKWFEDQQVQQPVNQVGTNQSQALAPTVDLGRDNTPQDFAPVQSKTSFIPNKPVTQQKFPSYDPKLATDHEREFEKKKRDLMLKGMDPDGELSRMLSMNQQALADKGFKPPRGFWQTLHYLWNPTAYGDLE